MSKKRNFCDISPTCYKISVKKEILKRHLKNLSGKVNFSETVQSELLPYVIHKRSSNMIKRAPGVNLTHQYYKANNIDLACKAIDGMIIKPGETFSFWKTIGNTSKRRGYKEGRVIENNRLVAGLGGGLCNLGNTIHLLVLHTPLKVTEFHTHSDALAPEQGTRIPLNTGTSVCYNYIDFRFENITDQNVQLHLWCEGEFLYAEIRSEHPFRYTYNLVEDDHHYEKINDKYYSISKIYREVIENDSIIGKELIWDNKSEVMYDYSLIPNKKIR